MLYKDNKYTEMFGSLLSNITDSPEIRPMFLVGSNLIFGKVISPDDERLNKTELSKGDSVFFASAANIISYRELDFDSDTHENDPNGYEPVYLYLEDVLIHSTSANKNIHIPEFALRISSIDGISIGNIKQFKSE